MPTRKLTKDEEQNTLWSLLFGTLIWFTHLNVLNMLTSVACKWSWFPFVIAGIPGLHIVEMIISLVALLLMLYMIYLAWQNWSKFQTKEPARNPNLLRDTEKDRRPLVAFIAMLMNSILFLFVFASFALLFFLPACGQH